MRIAAACLLAACGSTASPSYPAAKIDDVTDVYHGVTVHDPYRWLEADGDPAVAAWSAAENSHARAILDRLPEVDALRAELRAIVAAPITQYRDLKPGGSVMFALRKQPTKEQAELVSIIAFDPPAVNLVLDPAANGGGPQRAIDWFAPSPMGDEVAVSMSDGGSEAGTLHIIDTEGNQVEPPIPNVQYGTGGGSVAWTLDGFYYTRYAQAGTHMQVWFHGGGADRYEVGKDLPKIAEIALAADKRGRVLASVQLGDGGTFRHYLRDDHGWRQLDDWGDGVVFATFSPGGDLWLVSRKDAPRGKILRLAADARSVADAEVVVAQGPDAIATGFPALDDLVVTGDRVFARYIVGGPSEIRAFTLAGAPASGPKLPPVSRVGRPVYWGSDLFIGATSFTTPYAVRRFELPGDTAGTELAMLSPRPPVDLSGFEVSREVATSKDGTKVPLTIVWPKSAPRDGSTPCIATGYGGYGIAREPSFLAMQSVLLRRGVCWVDVNLRGGNEFGEDWHRAGALVHKQNVFDDFYAALQFLLDRHYTSSRHLGLIGGSNGGLLMGAMITQHPDIANVVVSSVGIYDMIRTERSPNGAYNVTEYGTVADPAQFAALYAYSPYHHVVAGTKYPAILMTTGANDPRVSPWQSRKMIAALQAAGTSNERILLRTSDKAGHGMGSSMTETIELAAHQYAFLLAHVRGP